MRRSLFFLLIIVPQIVHCQEQTWSKLYRKFFEPQEIERLMNKQEVVYETVDTIPFTQLILSWNAIKPERGHYTFWLKARDAQTGTWGQWHKAMEWGAGVARSFASIESGADSYHHVRLEIPKDHKANGFAVKIVGNNAHLGGLRAYAVNLSDMSSFKSENPQDILGQLSQVYIENVPQKSQFELEHSRKDSLCSPTSCAMLLSYLTGSLIDPAQFAQGAYDGGLDAFGSWPFNLAHAFEIARGKNHFFVARLGSFNHLCAQLKNKIPVVVSVRGAIEGAPKAYPNGHLLVVVGYDSKEHKVICHDPAALSSDQVVKRYALAQFLTAWERSHRLSYVTETR